MAFGKQLTSWSFSRWKDYDTCPLKAKLKHIDKIKEPPNPAMERGSAIGKMAEQYLKGELPKLPLELAKFKAQFEHGRKLAKKSKLFLTIVEDTWAFTKDWLETTWNDWAGCWLRIKLDWAYSEDQKTLYLTDWKTGKFRPDDIEDYLAQLELYALGALVRYPLMERVIPCLRYLDLGRTYPDPAQGETELIYLRTHLPLLKATWLKRVKPMMNDTKFAPKPNRWCGYCHYRASNKANGGGQCKY